MIYFNPHSIEKTLLNVKVCISSEDRYLPSKLFEQKFWKESEEVVFPSGYLIIPEFLVLKEKIGNTIF